MPTPTRGVLDIQSDLRRSTVPIIPTDVANKSYVDAAIAGAVPIATSAPGGGTLGRVTADELKGLVIPAMGKLEVKVDGVTIGFNGGGQLAATIPTATSANGGGVVGKATYDDLKGLHVTAGVAEVKIDGATVTFNGSGQLVATAGALGDATAAPGGGVKGKVTLDSDLGLDATAGVARVKVDGSTISFNGSGQLQSAGGSTGLVSDAAALARVIPLTTPPTPITLGTNIDAASYPDGSTTGEKFALTVPDDYFSGALELIVVYKMSTAVGGPNNQIRISTAAEIAKVTGSVDVATYPETQADLTTPITTNFTRAVVLTLTAGTFEKGDQLAILIRRYGAHASDLHTGAWEIVSYEWRYTAIVNSRVADQVPQITRTAFGEAATTPVTLGTNIDAEAFLTGADSGLRFAIIVPDNWDTTTDAFVSFTYSMSTAAVGTVRINTYGEIADVLGGGVVALASQNFDFVPPVGTVPHRIASFRSIPAALLTKGDALTIVAARRVGVGGNHGGSFRLVGITVQFAIAPTNGFTQSVVTEHYLGEPTYLPVVGAVTGDSAYPSFGTTFDRLHTMSSTSAAGRIDVAFPGRLASFQGQITYLRVNVIGTGASPEYHLQVYADGSGLVYDSGLQPAPGALTEVVVLAAALSAQPTGMKRLHVVVQAFIDAGESVAVSSPFMRQE